MPCNYCARRHRRREGKSLIVSEFHYKIWELGCQKRCPSLRTCIPLGCQQPSNPSSLHCPLEEPWISLPILYLSLPQVPSGCSHCIVSWESSIEAATIRRDTLRSQAPSSISSLTSVGSMTTTPSFLASTRPSSSLPLSASRSTPRIQRSLSTSSRPTSQTMARCVSLVIYLFLEELIGHRQTSLIKVMEAG